MGKLSGKVAIVTGGGRGIGRGIALCLARAGADVIIADISEINAIKVAEEIKALGRDALGVKVDVTKWEQVQGMVKKTLDKFAKIDILVNNVGIFRGGLIVGFPEKDWDDTFDVNVKSCFLCSKAVLPHMMKRRNGKIINIASQAGKRALPTETAYSASKSAVIGFTQGLALEVTEYNINVNAICPGLVWTDIERELFFQAAKRAGKTITEEKAKEEFDRDVKKSIPLGRAQTPEDVGNMVVFLASDEGENVTAQAFNVCGGMQISF